MHGQLHRRLRERAIGFCAGIKKTERKRRQFMNIRVLRGDDLLERFCALQAELLTASIRYRKMGLHPMNRSETFKVAEQ